ncbi:acyltransferase family protein [Geodermatophilus sp. SYSU D00779]
MAPATLRTPRHKPRLDIQGLRAIAVGLVVAYHLRPDVLSGGFVGVDVFFVISGFLIVGSLGREAARTGTISLIDFYTKRIRRLLPASTLVLLVTMLATIVLMPVSRWQGTAEGLVAAALQAQNWALALSSGYGAATEAVSPLQHYWSLAVEEQFYLVAPLLLMALCWLAGRIGRPRASVLVAGLVVLTVASFAHSVTFSLSHHDTAYFATTTRMWELTAGGLLALLGAHIRLTPVARAVAGWAGLGGIALSALTFTTAMAFPGWVALVPVLGAVLVIVAGTPADPDAPVGLVPRLLSTRLMTYVGDTSYSLYLWHWPVIVFSGFLMQRPPTKVECLLLIALSLGLAHVATRYVEQPFRSSSGTRTARAVTPRGAFRLAGALVAASLVCGALPWAYVVHRQGQLGDQRLDAQHPGGADVLPNPVPRYDGVPVIPDPAVGADDRPVVDADDCAVYDPRTMDLEDACVYGDASSPLTVVLTGDSHALQYSTALDQIGESQGWRVQTLSRNGCPFGASPAITPTRTDIDCTEANKLTRDQILGIKPSLVVTSAMNPVGYESTHEWYWESWDAQVAGYRELWQPLLDAGIRVAVIRDVPTPDYVGPECVELHGPDAAECSMSRTEAVDEQPDPAVAAAEGLDGVHVVDLTDHLCNREVCPGVIGNVLVYRDNHLTDTFATSLAEPMSRALTDLV